MNHVERLQQSNVYVVLTTDVLRMHVPLLSKASEHFNYLKAVKSNLAKTFLNPWIRLVDNFRIRNNDSASLEISATGQLVDALTLSQNNSR